MSAAPRPDFDDFDDFDDRTAEEPYDEDPNDCRDCGMCDACTRRAIELHGYCPDCEGRISDVNEWGEPVTGPECSCEPRESTHTNLDDEVPF